MTKVNHILIDYENVQSIDLNLINSENFKVSIFVGSSQSKIPFELVQKMQNLGNRAEWVKISGAGPNALDFHIAYYLGVYSVEAQDAFYHIISKDKGFDPLVESLKQKKIMCLRENSLDEIPIIKQNQQPKNQTDKLSLVVEKLKKGPKPRTLQTLTNSIKSQFALKIEQVEIDIIISSLKDKKIIQIQNENKIEYKNVP